MNEIKSRKNPLSVHMKSLGAGKEYRKKTGEFLCDGIKLFHEAIACSIEITCVFTCERDIYEAQSDKNIFLVPKDILTYVSPLKTPQSILFSCKIPEISPPRQCHKAIVLENLQDPGNVGTIIRTANAFCMDAVILTGDCADLYNPKTIRAAMGAVFRQTVLTLSGDELWSYIESQGLKLYGTGLANSAVSPVKADFKNAAVAIGSEGRGLSDELMERCRSIIKIPMNPVCESLNAGVAASVIMWEMYKGN